VHGTGQDASDLVLVTSCVLSPAHQCTFNQWTRVCTVRYGSHCSSRQVVCTASMTGWFAASSAFNRLGLLGLLWLCCCYGCAAAFSAAALSAFCLVRFCLLRC
jgi:hypothetical protein